jgi:putative DNA-invertase from lambdoid prophage Rac
MAQQEVTRAAIWARVSTSDQRTTNQLDELRAWAASRGVEVVAEFITEDSAWATGLSNGKGAEFDRKRAELLDGARLGRYHVVLTWGIDRLSRRGAEDMLSFVRRLTETGCALWSMKDPWVESTSDPFARELMIGIFGTLARFESERRSQRVKAGLARRKREGKPVGGRKPGAKDKAKRNAQGVSAAWTPERRAELAERNRQRAAARKAEREDG